MDTLPRKFHSPEETGRKEVRGASRLRTKGYKSPPGLEHLVAARGRGCWVVGHQKEGSLARSSLAREPTDGPGEMKGRSEVHRDKI